MKMTKKKARKLMGLVAMINKNEAVDRREYNRFTQFKLDLKPFGGWWHADFSSVAHMWYTNLASNSLYSNNANGFHEPSTVYLYDDDVCYREFGPVVAFIRAAAKAGKLDKLKYGTMEVVSKMTDYLDFEVKQ
jgi:hypothetical protein